MILAFDTASALTSVAVVDGDSVVVERAHLDARRHAEVMAPLLAEVIDAVPRAGFTAIACGVGPGPYTGLRVGIATALAVGAAWRLPVHGLCSLDAVAMAVLALGRSDTDDGVCVALDARRKEVYWARYDLEGTRVDGPRVASPHAIDRALRSRTWAGHGAVLHADDFARLIVDPADQADTVSPSMYPRAGWIGRRVAQLLATGQTDTPTAAPLDAHGDDSGATANALHGAALLSPRPLYLRRPDVTVTGP